MVIIILGVLNLILQRRDLIHYYLFTDKKSLPFYYGRFVLIMNFICGIMRYLRFRGETGQGLQVPLDPMLIGFVLGFIIIFGLIRIIDHYGLTCCGESTLQPYFFS